ncbi:hypothetical protein [Pseudoxanthomonas sp. JBR18]|uniref:hypothetical protein n=1 Tax=Pseudoxanthomonas sp. JBR18 TaxID=2969308 RepID=UPI002305F1CE|nr:hypothetical protein [Pseudoxanthomonas sp. JBR18]WCE05542.1 hypothetical protein PJ250_06160 [Pseudoxanthomonas sp. JBR18]
MREPSHVAVGEGDLLGFGQMLDGGLQRATRLPQHPVLRTSELARVLFCQLFRIGCHGDVLSVVMPAAADALGRSIF